MISKLISGALAQGAGQVGAGGWDDIETGGGGGMRCSECGDSFMLRARVVNHPVILLVSAIVPISYLLPVIPPCSQAVSLAELAHGLLARASQKLFLL